VIVAMRPLQQLARGSLGAYALRAAVAGFIGLLVIAPAVILIVKGLENGPMGVWEAVTEPPARAALWLSFWTSVVAAVVNGVVGTAIAWALVRWDLPFRGALAALVDLPLAIPTLVAGIVLVALFGPQSVLGAALEGIGFPVAYAWPGIVLALLLVTLPFVVRAVEPVLAELDPGEEEAAATLGANRTTTFFRVLLPPLLPAVAAGMVQTFARSMAEFGSLVAVSGNIPFQTLVAPVYVLGEVEGGNPSGAASVSLVLLAVALSVQPISAALARRAGGRGE
jgi:sulfate/thiosulfate transport system permease protein